MVNRVLRRSSKEGTLQSDHKYCGYSTVERMIGHLLWCCHAKCSCRYWTHGKEITFWDFENTKPIDPRSTFCDQELAIHTVVHAVSLLIHESYNTLCVDTGVASRVGTLEKNHTAEEIGRAPGGCLLSHRKPQSLAWFVLHEAQACFILQTLMLSE